MRSQLSASTSTLHAEPEPRASELAAGTAVIEAASLALLEGPRLSAALAAESLPLEPGLYAIFASQPTRGELGLPERPLRQPIYVGKAEDSLLKRDGQKHFKEGETSQSTLRRSIAALLRDPLQLLAQPRNPDNPGYFDRFGLDLASERVLQRWIGEHLEISTWVKPAGVRLLDVERGLLRLWTPPLNLTDNPGRWPELKKIRRVMADDARRWAGEPH